VTRPHPVASSKHRRKIRKKPPPPSPAAPSPAAPSPTASLEQRALPIVTELARVANAKEAPRVKLEGAMEIIFGAYGESDLDFSGLFLNGWLRAREEKDLRLTLAWQREQIRLCLRDILAEGAAAGSFRADLEPETLAALILNAAEGCLLQSATQGGPVPAEQLLRAMLRLVTTGA
jgi:hypothetical protein